MVYNANIGESQGKWLGRKWTLSVCEYDAYNISDLLFY